MGQNAGWQLQRVLHAVRQILGCCLWQKRPPVNRVIAYSQRVIQMIDRWRLDFSGGGDNGPYLYIHWFDKILVFITKCSMSGPTILKDVGCYIFYCDMESVTVYFTKHVIYYYNKCNKRITLYEKMNYEIFLLSFDIQCLHVFNLDANRLWCSNKLRIRMICCLIGCRFVDFFVCWYMYFFFFL